MVTIGTLATAPCVVPDVSGGVDVVSLQAMSSKNRDHRDIRIPLYGEHHTTRVAACGVDDGVCALQMRRIWGGLCLSVLQMGVCLWKCNGLLKVLNAAWMGCPLSNR